MIDRLRFRCVDIDTGEIVFDHELVQAEAEAAAVVDAAEARERVERGQRIRLEVTDPDGVLFPADQWITIDIQALR